MEMLVEEGDARMGERGWWSARSGGLVIVVLMLRMLMLRVGRRKRRIVWVVGDDGGAECGMGGSARANEVSGGGEGVLGEGEAGEDGA